MSKWTCPGCRKQFEIPEGWKNPKFCAECRELARGGPPKAPVPPKPVPEIVLTDASSTKTPANERRFPVAIVVRVAAVVGVVAVVVSAFAYNRAEYRNLERAWEESRELDRKQDEIVEERREKKLDEILNTKPIERSIDKPITGDIVRVGQKEGNATILVRDWPDHAEMTKFLLAKDSYGIKEMFLQGRAFAVNFGTSAKVLQTGIQAFELRILDGDQAGKSGWLEKGYFIKAN